MSVIQKLKPLIHCIKESCKRILSLYPIEDEKEKNSKDPKHRLMSSMKVTSVCRFNASLRITLISKIAFLTTTVFSLGLILIPLLQMILKENYYNATTLTVVQIFLAVSVLVYSTIIGTAKYDVRAKELDRCGIDIKSIIRKLREENANVAECTKLYDEVIKNCENHTRSDYKKAQLYLTEYFQITGIKRLYYRACIFTLEFIPYIIPIILVLLEIIFILDMVGITKVFNEIFK